jgi:hypothetical protein
MPHHSHMTHALAMPGSFLCRAAQARHPRDFLRLTASKRMPEQGSAQACGQRVEQASKDHALSCRFHSQDSTCVSAGTAFPTAPCSITPEIGAGRRQSARSAARSIITGCSPVPVVARRRHTCPFGSDYVAPQLHLGQWPQVLRFAQEQASSMRERGVPLPEVAFAEFSSTLPAPPHHHAGTVSEGGKIKAPAPHRVLSAWMLRGF